MAIYSTFFLCDPKELSGGFPGWRMPLERPVKREFLNPFTGEKTVVESREPEWPEDDAEEVAFHPEVVSIKGDYQAYLESRIPPFVRGRPHWAAKGLTPVELEPLFEAMGFKGEMPSAMYAPPSRGSVLEQLPAQFLAGVGSTDLGALAKRWAAAMSTPDHTHSVTGQRLSDGWKQEEALAMLQPLADLARKPPPGQHMYLLTEM